MTGECTGKVRSTPTPKLTLRTVNVSRTPSPCRRMTTPWNSWTRERLPSTTFTCTLRVSPARKAGTSSRRLAASSESSVCMGCRFLVGATGHSRASGGGRRPLVVRRLPRGGAATGSWRDCLVCHSRGVALKSPQQVGSALGGARQPLLVAPLLDPAVVARQQDVGHLAAAPGRRLGVDGVLEQAALVALLHQALGVADDAGQQPGHRLDDREHGDLSPVQHVVAEADRGDPHRGGGVLEHPLVDALVPPAGERQPRLGGQLVRHRLVEPDAGRAGHQQVRLLRRRSGRLGAHVVERLAPRLGPHDHAGAAAVRGVVDGAVPVVGEVAQVVHHDVEQPLLAGIADQRETERREVVGKDRDDVDAHAAQPWPGRGGPATSASPANIPPGGSRTTRPPGTSTSGTSAVTNGTSTSSPPPAGRTTSRSWAAPVSSRTTSPRSVPSTCTARSPTSSWSYQASGSSEAVKSTVSSVPRSASASSRVSTPANRSSSTLWSRGASSRGSSAGGV